MCANNSHVIRKEITLKTKTHCWPTKALTLQRSEKFKI